MRGAAFLTIAACALLAGAAPAPERPAGYLEPAERPDALAILAPPPAEGSPAAAADLAAFRATRSLAGGPRWQAAIDDVRIFEPGAFERWSCAAGAPIDEVTTPATWRLLRRSVIDPGLGTYPAKAHYDRPRPFVGNDLPVCTSREALEGNASYPSGHAAVGWAWALILAELKPERATPILARGRAFGDSRVVCGVHYPSDVEAGRLYGAAAVARLHADPEFQADLAAAKAELAALPAGLAPAGCEP